MTAAIETPAAPTTTRREPTRKFRGCHITRYPDGVEVRRYDDGQLKIGRWDSKLIVDDLRNFGIGASQGSGYVKLHFEPIPR